MKQSRTLWPIGILCCLGLILLLLASSIVLSLIPIYLPNHSLSKSQTNFKNNELFYVEYRSTATNGVVGTVNNIDEIKKQYNKQLGFSNDQINVTKVQIINDTNSKQRRHLQRHQYLSYRNKRASGNYRILLTCTITYLDSCLLTSCRKNFLAMIYTKIAQKTNLSLQFSFASILGFLIQYSLTYASITASIPVQFFNSNGDDTTITATNVLTSQVTSVTRSNSLASSTQSVIMSTSTNSTNVDECEDLDACDVYENGSQDCEACDDLTC